MRGRARVGSWCGRDLALPFLAPLMPVAAVAALAELGAALWRRGGTVAVLARRPG
jgi:hypothetical protein